MKGSTSARALALDVLTRVDEQHAYSNLLLNQMLQKHQLERQDVGLATEIVYGTIQRRNTIDYFLDRFVAKGVAKLQPWVRNLLRLSFYQLYYLERIPSHAIVNEAVNLAKHRGHKGISGLVNGVLRNVLRAKDKAQLVLPEQPDPIERIALAHSHPAWLVARWIEQYGEATAEAMCAANNEPPHVSVRVNAMKAQRDALLADMRQHVDATASMLAEDGIIVKDGGNMAKSAWFKDGELSIQDESSMLVAPVVAAKPGMRVLDCCAAPGGKTMHIAERMNDEGAIWANDLHPHKQALIDEQAERLRLGSVKTVIGDAKRVAERFSEKSFDRILVDAPCSGTGVIRRKPDLKWLKSEADIKPLPDVQLSILSAAAPLLKADGLLVYSTCTVEQEENEGVIRAFLERHPQFELDRSSADHLPQHVSEKIASDDGMLRVLPHYFNTDGFFIARLRLRS